MGTRALARWRARHRGAQSIRRCADRHGAEGDRRLGARRHRLCRRLRFRPDRLGTLRNICARSTTASRRARKNWRGPSAWNPARRCATLISRSIARCRRFFSRPRKRSASPARPSRWMHRDGMPSSLGIVIREPLGVVVAIGPFNYPLNLLAHKVGPAIAANNAVVVKPASRTPLTALKMAELFIEAGLPPRMLQVITGDASEISDALITDPRVRKITFTGSISVGKAICAKAGLQVRLHGARRQRPVDRAERRGSRPVHSRCRRRCLRQQRRALHLDQAHHHRAWTSPTVFWSALPRRRRSSRSATR